MTALIILACLLGLLVLRRVGPLVLRWASFVFALGAVVELKGGGSLAALSDSVFGLVLAIVLWTAGTVWYAWRHTGWPGPVSRRTLGHVELLYPWLGSDLGVVSWRAGFTEDLPERILLWAVIRRFF
jgi:hypothetical protein